MDFARVQRLKTWGFRRALSARGDVLCLLLAQLPGGEPTAMQHALLRGGGTAQAMLRGLSAVMQGAQRALRGELELPGPLSPGARVGLERLIRERMAGAVCGRRALFNPSDRSCCRCRVACCACVALALACPLRRHSPAGVCDRGVHTLMVLVEPLGFAAHPDIASALGEHHAACAAHSSVMEARSAAAKLGEPLGGAGQQLGEPLGGVGQLLGEQLDGVGQLLGRAHGAVANNTQVGGWAGGWLAGWPAAWA